MSPFGYPTRLPNPPPPQVQCRTPGALPRWAPAGSGKSVCTSSEKKKIEDAFQTAFAWVDSAKNYLDQLAELSPAKRERMWNWGSFLPGSIHESVAHRWDDYWSPGTWFGWYTHDRFYTVWDRVTRLWYRMQDGTKKNYVMRFVCRAHRNCFGVAAAYHSPTSVGRVTLCKDWFGSANTPMERAEKILHESMHYLVNDSIVTNRPKDVRSKTACGSKGKLSNVCYRATNSYSLRSLWEAAAVDNIDNYNYWMRTMFYTVGCWPPPTFPHMGYNLGNWVAPAPLPKQTLVPPITKKFFPLPGHKELKPPIPTKTLDP